MMQNAETHACMFMQTTVSLIARYNENHVQDNLIVNSCSFNAAVLTSI